MSAFIRPFLPWIAYAVLGAFLDWRWGALGGLLLTAAGLVALRRAGRAWDAAVIELCSVVYFAAVTVIAFADPHSALHPYTQGASSLWLALAAWGSLLAGRPFTLGIARTQVPAAFWDAPAFRRVNTVITTVWAAAFTVSGALLLALPGRGTTDVLITVAGFVVPAVLTGRVTAAARSRAAAATATA